MVALIKRNLEGHEEIIAAGVKSFLDVGQSLMAIRDEKLYAKDYENFEAYCDKRWGFSKPRAYQYIESAVVVSDLKLSTNCRQADALIPENEGQARALAGVADDATTRAAVWTAVVETAPKDGAGKPKVTAAFVKKVAKGIKGTKRPRKKKPKTGKVELSLGREPGDDPVEPEHVIDKNFAVDRSGKPLPERPALIKAFSSGDLFHSCEAARNAIQTNCLQIAQLIPDGKAFAEHMDKALKGMFHMIENYRPAYVCSTCTGGGCSRCLKRGYTTWTSK